MSRFSDEDDAKLLGEFWNFLADAGWLRVDKPQTPDDLEARRHNVVRFLRERAEQREAEYGQKRIG